MVNKYNSSHNEHSHCVRYYLMSIKTDPGPGVIIKHEQPSTHLHNTIADEALSKNYKKVFLFPLLDRAQVYKKNFNNKTGLSPGLQKGRMSDESFNCSLVIIIIMMSNKEGKRWPRTKQRCINYSLFLQR